MSKSKKDLKRKLTEEEVLYYLENDADADIDFLSDSEVEDLQSDIPKRQIHSFLDEIIEPNNENEDEHKVSDVEDTELINEKEKLEEAVNNRNGTNDNGQLKKDIQNFEEIHGLTDKSKIEWILGENVTYQTRNIQWNSTMPINNPVDLPAPIDFFSKYIPDEILQQMADMTNLYATQKDLARFPATNMNEIKTFIGIHITMGNLQFPRVSIYWHRSMGIPLVKEAMSQCRFYKLRQAMHLVDITSREENNKDRLWKVRCLYDSVRRRCLQLPLETNLSVDEQIIPFKGQINIKQYIKNKPKKWGVKIYVLAGKSGMIYDFIIYQGSTTPLNPVFVKYGSAAAVVMQLSERISEKNHGLFFDNFFSTYNLFQYLDSKFIYAIGTIRANRFANPRLPSEKEMKKKGCGSSATSISKHGVVITKWYDNKPVLVASNFVGIGDQDSCRRWNKTTKEYVQVSRPEAIKIYNSNMGGVDKLDFLLSLYRSYVRSKKWTVRMISHAIDLALVNSWLEYRNTAILLRVNKKQILVLLAFRKEVAENLICRRHASKRGRPSNNSEDPGPSKKQKTEMRPIKDLRYDGFHHLPKYDDKKEASRCKHESCKNFNNLTILFNNLFNKVFYWVDPID